MGISFLPHFQLLPDVWLEPFITVRVSDRGSKRVRGMVSRRTRIRVGWKDRVEPFQQA